MPLPMSHPQLSIYYKYRDIMRNPTQLFSLLKAYLCIIVFHPEFLF